MEKKIFIVGAGSVGGHLACNFDEYCSGFEPAGFFDDDEKKIGTEFCGLNVIGPVKDALNLREAAIVIGIAFPGVKKMIVEKLKKNRELHFPTLIHPRAWVSGSTTIGQGCVVYPGTSINYGSEIGEFVVMNMNCALGHHTYVGNYSSLAPGVLTGGHTVISDEVEMGIGAATIQGISIGKGSMVGGHSMVTKNIPHNTVAKGVPAKFKSLER